MKDPIITYRGAKCPMSELSNQRVGQLEQQQGTRKVQYRGVTADVDLNAHPAPRKRSLIYRGAKLETEF